MRQHALPLVVLLMGLVAGCSNGAVSPTSPPTRPPSPTPAGETVTVTPLVGITPSGPAECVVEPIDFPTNSAIPAVTEEEHIHGPADAPITLVEYGDFQ